MSGDIQPPAWAAALEGRLRNDIRGEAGNVREALTGRIDGVERRIDATRAAIMERIDGLQEDLERGRANAVVASGSAEMALRRNDNTRGDVHTLTDMVLALSHQVRRMDAEIRVLRGEGGA